MRTRKRSANPINPRQSAQPTIGITLGDPAGIGPEVALKALSELRHAARWIVYGSRQTLDANLRAFAPGLVPQSGASAGSFDVREILPSGTSIWGRGTSDTGQEALSALRTAIDDALELRIDGIVTAPVSKRLIGRGFTGQTEELASRSGVSDYAMAFFTPTFKVVLATVHESLRHALDALNTEGYLRLIRLIDRELRAFGFVNRRIALSGINPHIGEDGAFGTEDQEILVPAVTAGRLEGLDVSGPFPADSLYYRAHTGEFDVVLAPYHDQGLAPVKLIAHGTSVNVTLGLPFVRTSPDHGTAFEIAGQGIADTAGMRSAMSLAIDLVLKRQMQSRHSGA